MTAVKERSEIRDFTTGSLTKHLIKFAFFSLGANLMMILLNTVDMIVVGQTLGEAGSSAIAVGGQVSTFLNTFINGFSAAGQILIARLVGMKEREKISRLVSTMAGILFVAGVVVMAVMLPLNGVILDLLNTPPEAYDGAYAYSMICLIGVLPIFAYHVIASILRGMGDVKHPFIFIAIACGLNIILDVLFVAVFGWGVAGAAMATVIAQLISVVFSLGLLVRKRAAFALSMRWRDFICWDREQLSEYLKLGIPLALKNSAIQISGMAVSSMTNDYGVSVSAFSGIRANIVTTANLVTNATVSAGSMIIAQNLAAGSFFRVKATMRRVGAFTLSLAALFSLAILAFPMQIFGLFTDEPSVLAIVGSYLPIAVFSFVGMGVRAVTASLINGSGNKMINLVIALLDAIVARIGFAYLFGIYLGFGYLGFWFGGALSGYVPILIGIVFYVSGIWKKSGKKQTTKGEEKTQGLSQKV